MRIASTQITLDYECLEIFISGCNPPHCKGCCNPELWDFDYGNYLHKNRMAKKINNSFVNKIFIVGGDPIHQPKIKLIKFLDWLKSFKKPIWLFTREKLENIDKEILKRLDYIKTGEYIQGSKTVEYFGVTLASDNQKITKLR